MYPTLYEINTRPWLKQFGVKATLADIPDDYWISLKEKGIDYIWLMGVWETSQDSIEKHCFHPDLVRAYDEVSTKWTKQDISGSPYAIEDYIVSRLLGSKHDLFRVKRQINRLGLKLILDFVPNHFNAHSQLVLDHPEVFIHKQSGAYANDQTFFSVGDRLFAHGRDPYFPPWSDTVQINYFNQNAQQFMTDRLLDITKLCDGVRCDMAMLVLPDIFSKTWGFLNPQNTHANDFWTLAIAKVKEQNRDFLFIAEAYWDTQWRLQQLGFDYTYDKEILDLLKEDNISQLKLHLKGSLEYQNRCIRFIENHDEERSLRSLGDEKTKAAAILFSTIPGMKLYYDGQWQGQRKKYPVQMGTFFENENCACGIKVFSSSPADPCACMYGHYQSLLKVLDHAVFKKGNWSMIDVTGESTVVFLWQYEEEERIVAVNLGNSPELVDCNLPMESRKDDFIDLLNGQKNPSYARVRSHGIRFELPGYKGCILSQTKSQN
jgi:hypothetical protein